MRASHARLRVRVGGVRLHLRHRAHHRLILCARAAGTGHTHGVSNGMRAWVGGDGPAQTDAASRARGLYEYIGFAHDAMDA